MPTFTAFGADILSNPNVNTVGGAGEDGAGQITVSPGSVPFPANYFIEFEVDNVLANGEFDGSTGFIGMTVYASQADFIAGTPLYTYAPQNANQTAAVQNSVDGIGDTYVRFNGSVLLSVDAGAPPLQNIFVAPGSGVAVGTTTVFDHHTDVDYDGNGSIDATPIEDGNGFFNIANSQAVCFTHDTMMLTPSGERPINDLRVGDYVTTADNGPQKIIWIGSRIFNQRSLLETPKLRPVFIPQGVLGATKPTLVSRQHAILG
ncbi:Hint domain-containing protein, partial [Planktotalea sp.]|uniref:Hint domain-containing protein n=1 Tax=Planktotalea sp. TaxID=2029877 RepID=UPI00329A66FE